MNWRAKDKDHDKLLLCPCTKDRERLSRWWQRQLGRDLTETFHDK